MSAGFDTQNLFLIDEEEGTLVFYDALRFEATTLPLRSLGLLLHQETFDAVSGFALARVKKLQEEEPEDFDVQAAGSSALGITQPLLALAQQEWPTAETGLLEKPDFIPGYDLRFWVLVSDAPRESFHAEDYEEKVLEPFDSEEHVIPIDFAVEIDSLGGAIRQFPMGSSAQIEKVLEESGAEGLNESGRQAWALLSLPKGKTTTGALSPELPLPILREFVGPKGVGITGKMVNLTIDMEAATEFQCAIPFLQFQNTFITVYGHLLRRDDTPNGISPWATVSKPKRMEATLLAAGFKQHASTDETGRAAEYGEPVAQIWNRGKDWVHLYLNPPGLEALGRHPLPSFLFAATSEGSREPAGRAELIHELQAAAKA